jgi:hypothetical protein
MAAIRGGETDRKPQLSWPDHTPDSDAAVLTLDQIGQEKIDETKPILLEVLNPFGLAQSRGTNPNSVLEDDPATGDKLLQGLAAEVKHLVDAGIAAGVDGFLYRLHGANPAHSTPMQYGGHFLEVDREILASFDGLPIRAVFVVGGEGTFLDFVSDLPAELFGWDVEKSETNPNQVRQYRSGALMAASPDADVYLSFPGDISSSLRMESIAAHA